jgi:hypothetical protein
LVLIVRLPDTARWLLMNGRREEAADLLRRVEPDMDPEEEVRRIEHDLSYEEKGSFAELFQGRFRKAGIFVVGLGFLVQITGINAIVYYSPTIIQEVGVTSPTGAIIATGFVQVAGVIAEVVAFLVVDRWGRRPTLLTGIGTMGAANAILVLAYALNSPATFTLLGILLFTVGFNFGYGSLVWVYASESFPVRLRTQGGSAMLTADLFANFIVGSRVPRRPWRFRRLGYFRDLLRPGTGLVRLRLHTRPRDQGTTAGSDPLLLVQRRTLARGDQHLSLPQDRDQSLHLAPAGLSKFLRADLDEGTGQNTSIWC